MRAEYDRRILRKLVRRLRGCRKIGIYVSVRSEADTRALIRWCLESGRTAAVPRITGRTLSFIPISGFPDLFPSVFGLLEPRGGTAVLPGDLDAVIVPLSAFDRSGNRTGYGGGYYDSVLKECRCRIGIAYHVQEVDEIETDSWDVKLDEIVTDL